MKKIALITLCIASLLIGFAFGFRTGREAIAYSEFTIRGSIATYLLGHLEARNKEPIKIVLEHDVEKAKWAHAQLMSPLYIYGAQLSGVPIDGQNPKYIERVNAYSPKSSE